MTAQVLVVDDEFAVRTTEAAILRAAGYEVLEASDGLEALALLRDREVGAVVLDVRMPSCDGIAVASALEDPPPIVLVSAHVLDEEEIEQLSGKVAVFLDKPVPPTQLLEQVRLALQGENA
jgi:DNA-binding response OmpR family regulator